MRQWTLILLRIVLVGGGGYKITFNCSAGDGGVGSLFLLLILGSEGEMIWSPHSMRLGALFYFAIVYFVIVSLWAIGEAIVYDCAVRLLFLNNFASSQSW